jgi:GNAT superfamily N-acetyltransferase
VIDPAGSEPGPDEPQPLIVRPAEVQDADAVASLSLQLGYEATSDEIRLRIADLSRRENSQAVFVACIRSSGRGGGPDEAQVVGWIEMAITFHLQSPPFVLIGGLVVKDGIRGLGIGRRLCEEAEQWTRERGIDLIRVTSRSTRPDAHRFYLRDGYKETKICKVFEKTLGS